MRPFETFTFSEADPSKTLEFELEGEVAAGLVSRLLDVSFLQSSASKGAQMRRSALGLSAS